MLLKAQAALIHSPVSYTHLMCIRDSGWTVTRGAGQNRTYYGTIADIVVSQKYATPIGKIETSHSPREADVYKRQV